MKTVPIKPEPMTLDELSDFIDRSLDNIECRYLEFKTPHSMQIDIQAQKNDR